MAVTTKIDNPSTVKKQEARKNLLEKLSSGITESLENFFYFWGYQIATRPWVFICGCLAFTLISTIGLLRLTIENRPDKLWIPKDSEFIKDTEWLKSNFPSPIRIQYGIIESDDVLQPDVIKTLIDIHKRLESVTNSNKKSWKDLCFKLPVTKFGDENNRRRRSISANNTNYSVNLVPAIDKGVALDFSGFEDEFADDFFQDKMEEEFDHSILLPEKMYCDIVNSLPEACWEVNLAEVWGYKQSLVDNLTKEDILRKLNQLEIISPIFGRPINISADLGGIERNETGHIVKAKAILLRWYTKINQTQLATGEDVTFDIGTGELIAQDNLDWEADFIDAFIDYTAPDGMKFYFKAHRRSVFCCVQGTLTDRVILFARSVKVSSFGDISQKTIFDDGLILGIGIALGFLYVLFMLGQFNCVEQRPLLAGAGLSCIGLAIVTSYGLCSGMGLYFGPVHQILPFLLLGIGIDDMFIIMQCWNNLPAHERKKSMPERVGLALKHAGVSITVTSVTDFAAFAVGGTTILPALRSFCIYASVGVIATYVFQATFFTAWLVLDMRRSEDNRNAFCCCVTHRIEYKTNKCSNQSYAQKIIEKVYAPILLTKTSKVIILVATFSFFGLNIYGNTQLRQEFNPLWFLPYDSYMYQCLEVRQKYFPEMGYDGFMIIDNLTIHENFQQLDDLETQLKATNKFSEFGFWYTDFKKYVNKNFDAGIPQNNITKQKFDKYMSKFLFSPVGSKYRGRMKFNGNITCGNPSPSVQLSLTNIRFRIFKGPTQHIPAMHEVKDVVKSSNFTSPNSVRAFLWSMAFASWETEEIITVELYRNMGLAMGCVLITTLLLITNLATCLMVLSCVVLTIVDVLGGMHFWGLTIDTVSTIDMVLAIGLCVDYGVHIGHTFMTRVGTRDERAKQTLVDIGPAVLNGGFTTFLAFALLTNSKSHVFITFFKIFFMVVTLGLYHGLVFLPVILSIVGPQPYSSAYERYGLAPADMECEVPLHINGSEANKKQCKEMDTLRNEEEMKFNVSESERSEM